MTARTWLRENGYADVAELINTVMAEWRAGGVGTRRNWWEVLAGGKDGAPLVVQGRTFPVLAVAQLHEGKPVTENALRRGKKEIPPPKVYLGRAGRVAKKAKKAKAKKG